MTYYGPALDLPLGGFGPKVNTNERGLEYFIPTKFGEYPSSDSVVKSDYVFSYIRGVTIQEKHIAIYCDIFALYCDIMFSLNFQ